MRADRAARADLGGLGEHAAAELVGAVRLVFDAVDARVVHQHVEPAVSFADAREHAIDRRRVRDVGGDAQPAELLRRAVRRRGVEVVHDDRRALVAKPPSDGEAESTRGPRDERNLPFESFHANVLAGAQPHREERGLRQPGTRSNAGTPSGT